jgi:hypothetical protein
LPSPFGSSRDSVRDYDITATIGVDGNAAIDSKLVETSPTDEDRDRT